MPKLSYLLLILFLILPPAAAQAQADEVVARYQMEVTLDAAARRLQAAQTITYRNQTSTPMPDVVFHLYMNAFRDENSLFMREGGGAHRGYGFNPDEAGWIEVESLRVAGGPALALELLEDGTLARAVLPEPVLPGETITLETTFSAQLPRVFARTGWALDAAGQPFFMVGQWFPKPGVWQGADGWNAYPFHANNEFFADYAVYDVTIHLPAGYVVGATGMPTCQVDDEGGRQTVCFRAENVVDFAFSASPSFQVESRIASLPAGDVELLYLVLPEHAWSVERALTAAETAMRSFSQWYGPYPYPRLTIVDVPDSGQGAGGMEYPTLITAGAQNIFGLPTTTPGGWERGLEAVIVHEVGHQWWMGLVGFNEAEEPWLDEGLTDYSTARVMERSYGEGQSIVHLGRLRAGYLDMRRLEYLSRPDVPMVGPAWSFTGFDYGVAAYSKPTVALTTLERVLGDEVMLRILSTFFETYRFQHPTTEDLRRTAEEVSGQDLAWWFDGLAYGAETLNYRVEAINERTLTVVREGQLLAPVEVEVEFADGSSRVEVWDGRESPRTFTFPDDPPIRTALIDPQRKLLVEQVWTDNGLRVSPDRLAWLAVFSGLLFALQDLLLMLGGL